MVKMSYHHYFLHVGFNILQVTEHYSLKCKCPYFKNNALQGHKI